MTDSNRYNGFRNRLRESLHRLRRKSQDASDHVNNDIEQAGASVGSTSEHLTPSPYLDVPGRATTPYSQYSQSIKVSDAARSSVEKDLNVEAPSRVIIVSSDLWTAAYCEAVESLGKDINVAILKGESVAELFKQLEAVDKLATDESAFLRGVRYLHSLQVPLEKFKLALDLASPFASVEPTAGTVMGVIKGVTAIAISISTADLEFAKQIGQMLEQLSYIDDCDTLGQKTNKKDIHQALVSVYQKLLEFYNTAFEILTRKGAKLVMSMILENGRLPIIVSDFLRLADHLRKLVQKATWEIVEDIKAMLYDHEIARWLGSGKLSQQSQYHAYLQEIRADRACTFLLADTTFIKWYHAPISQQLVILGDTGCGKTISMAFLIDELRRRNELQIPKPKICYHYCRNDDTGQALNIFSTLILSLLEQFSGMKKPFFEWYKKTTASGVEPATNFKKLEEWLNEALRTLDRPLFLVIDGLDECDRLARTTVLKSLGALSRSAPRLKILLSSRPQEEILEQLGDIHRINVAANDSRDRIIVESAVERQLFYLRPDIKAFVTETLSQSAKGSAIWTKMTVELIETRGIRALDPMRAFLEDIPQPKQLSMLYNNLFSRYTLRDPENQRAATTALEMLAMARRPLSIVELAWGVAMSLAPKTVVTVTALSMSVDHQRVMSLIQPFIANVDFGDLRRRQVRLVHQSVKEYILMEMALSRPGLQGIDVLKPSSTDDLLVQRRTESLEASILAVCIRYLRLQDINNMSLFTEEQVAIQELPQEVNLFTDDDEPNNYDVNCTWEVWEEDMIRYNPIERGFGEFFVYASCNWTEHYGAISMTEFLSPLEDIEALCCAGTVGLQNWTSQNCRPDCTFKPRFEFDSAQYDPLGITALYGSEPMLQHLLDVAVLKKDTYLLKPLMTAAEEILRFGNVARLKILFQSNVGDELRNLAFFQLVTRRWSNHWNRRRTGWEEVFSLVDDVLELMIAESWARELLCDCSKMGCVPLIKQLMARAQNHPRLRAELLNGPQSEHRAFAEAVTANQLDVVKYLLTLQGIESHLHHRTPEGDNILHLASKTCNPTMFELLVPHFQQDDHQMNHMNETPLVRAITSRSAAKKRHRVAQILLSNGGRNMYQDVEANEQHPLRLAVQMGDSRMCGVLVRDGHIDPLTAMIRDEEGRLMLKDPTPDNEHNRDRILQLLREHADGGSKL